MIVGDQKPIEDILSYLDDYERILLAGCHGCVTVCSAGGQKEVDILASLIEMAGKNEVSHTRSLRSPWSASAIRNF